MENAFSSRYADTHPFFREMRVESYADGVLELMEHGMKFVQSSLDWVRDADVGRFMGADFTAVSTQTEIDRIQEILANEDEYHWVIVLDGKAIGAISINEIHKTSQEYSRKAGSLTFLIGYPEYRGKGIASAVIQRVLLWAFDEAGFEVMLARSLQENMASQKTLRRLGFEECGTEPYEGLVQGKPSMWKKYRVRKGK